MNASRARQLTGQKGVLSEQDMHRAQQMSGAKERAHRVGVLKKAGENALSITLNILRGGVAEGAMRGAQRMIKRAKGQEDEY